MANRRAKKDPARGGVCLLDTEAAQTEALAALDLADVWGVGSRLVARLAGLGITTPLQLRAADPVLIRRQFSVVLQRTVLGPVANSGSGGRRGCPPLLSCFVRDGKSEAAGEQVVLLADGPSTREPEALAQP